MALTYPLITLSTRAQVESKRAQSSTLDAARRIIKRGALQDYMQGWTLRCLASALPTSFTTTGTNGLAHSSRRPRSRLVAPRRSSPRSSR